MKELPKVNTSSGDLYRTLCDPIRTKLLLTGIELGMISLSLRDQDMYFDQGEIDESML
jgi:hypothetical protein